MKVTVYSCREFDEKELFIQYGKELGIELVLCPDAPCMENAALAEGSAALDAGALRIQQGLASVDAAIAAMVKACQGSDGSIGLVEGSRSEEHTSELQSPS